ncbi:hypothetical protein [Geodermatophilus pulveris]|uniref:hypothetical protein n=1 Tax=Geodermatophilus pulveris TaxID=1564159 RepID=UPI00117A5AB3|nr:hypothetical protein [Geodermatophilus pulveris]
MVPSRAAAPAPSLAASLALGGCASDLEAEVCDLLQQRVDAVHADHLGARARDRRPIGRAAAEGLDPWGDALRTPVERDDVVLVRAVGRRSPSCAAGSRSRSRRPWPPASG